MPLYEFACRRCDRRFEELVRRGETPSCPGCASHDLERLMSAAAIGHAEPKRATSAPAGACGSCGDPRGPGACSMN